jgi:hypothetical protein
MDLADDETYNVVDHAKTEDELKEWEPFQSSKDSVQLTSKPNWLQCI